MGNLVPPNRNWVGHDTPVRMDLLHRVRNQELCRGTVSLKFIQIMAFKSSDNSYLNLQFQRSPDQLKDLRCHWLDHNIPYLKIGPFKFEVFFWNIQSPIPTTNVFIYCRGFSCFSLVNVNKFSGCRYLWISLFKTKSNA